MTGLQSYPVNVRCTAPIGRMVARQLCTIARYESEHRAEQVHMARERQARQGKFGSGRRPQGFETDGVTVIPEEAAAIMGIADAVLSGVPLRSISRDLRKLGVRPPAAPSGHRTGCVPC